MRLKSFILPAFFVTFNIAFSQQAGDWGVPKEIRDQLRDAAVLPLKKEISPSLGRGKGNLLKRSLGSDRDIRMPQVVRFLGDLGSPFSEYSIPPSEVAPYVRVAAENALKQALRQEYLPNRDDLRFERFKDIPPGKISGIAGGSREPYDLLRISYRKGDRLIVVNYVWKWVMLGVYPAKAAAVESSPSRDLAVKVFNKYFDLADKDFLNADTPRIEEISSYKSIGFFVRYQQPGTWTSPESSFSEKPPQRGERPYPPLRGNALTQPWGIRTKLPMVTDGDFIVLAFPPWDGSGEPITGGHIDRSSWW